MGAELGRWLIALGAVAAWSGVIVLGMGMSEIVPGESLIRIGLLVAVAGVVGLVAGIGIYRATIEPDETVG